MRVTRLKSPKAQINSICSFLGPRKIIRNPDHHETSKEIPRQTRWAQENSLPRDLALSCAKKMFKKFDIDPQSIDLVIYSSSFPDTVNIGFGSYLVESLAMTNTSVLQVECSCASFTAQLEIAQNLIRYQDHKKILVVDVSHMISRLDEAQKQTPGTRLGEGAATAIIQAGISNFEVENLIPIFAKPLSNVYPRRPEDHDWHKGAGPFTFFNNERDDRDLAMRSLESVNSQLEGFLSKHHVSLSNIDRVIFNHNDEKTKQQICKTLELPLNKVVSLYHETGDLAQSTVLTVLDQKISNSTTDVKQVCLIFNYSLDFTALGLALIRY